MIEPQNLIEYLESFPSAEEISFIVVDKDRRLYYEVEEQIGITDTEGPCIALAVGLARPFDDI